MYEIGSSTKCYSKFTMAKCSILICMYKNTPKATVLKCFDKISVLKWFHKLEATPSGKHIIFNIDICRQNTINSKQIIVWEALTG